MLSVLPRSTPALQLLVGERDERRARFEKIAARKIATGSWKRTQVQAKWVANLARAYRRLGYRVQKGPTGKQQPMKKGSPNPWAAYRDAEQRVGGPGTKGYVSPWEVKQVKHGKTRLEKGLVFVQRQERTRGRGGASAAQVREWIAQKEEAIRSSTGRRRTQLVIERNRLERML